MLVKVHLTTGGEEWMLVHLEIQERNDANFTLRMFQYYYRIYDRYGMHITAIAVFTGSKKQQQICSFEHAFLGTSVCYRFNTYHIFDHSEAELLTGNNPFGLIVLAAQQAQLAHKMEETAIADQRMKIARRLVEISMYNRSRVRKLIFFLKTFLHIKSEEINGNFDREVNLLTGKRSAMGIIETIKMLEREEAYEEAAKNKLKTFVLNLYAANQFTIEQIANFASATEEEVEAIITKYPAP